MIWELEINGARRSLADWGLSNVSLRRRNMAADVLQCHRIADFDVPELCGYRDPVALYRDSVCWFRGQRILIPAQATGASEGQSYAFSSPWAWLERNVMRNVWFADVETSHIITYGQIGGIIRAVLDYAISKGAPLTYIGAELDALAVAPPSNESTGKLCSSVILDALQFAPDVVTWFDYSTNPATLRFGRRASLAQKSLRTGADELTDASGVAVDGLQIVPRPDLQVPRVHLIFETITVENGQQRLSYRQEIAPEGAPFADGELSDVVVVQGRNETTVSGTLYSETITADETEAGLAWFKKHIAVLNDPRIVVRRIVPGSITRAGWDGTESLGLLRELIEGQAEEWMINDDDTPVRWQKEVIKVKFDLDVYEDSSQADPVRLDGDKAAEYIVELTSTNAPDGEHEYSDTATVDEGDPQPFGLAQYLYDSMHPLQYDARWVISERECSGHVNLGNTVNFIGGTPEHASMQALVQEVVFSIDEGLTDITCGPPRVLSINDILAIFKANRQRRRWTNAAAQSSGELGSSGRVTLGRGIANNNTIPGRKAKEYFATTSAASKIAMDSAAGELVVADKANPAGNHIKASVPSGLFEMVDGAGHAVTMRLSSCVGGTPQVARSLQIIEIPICVGGDNNWRRLILGSEPYRP